jgi:hypothetical protein
MHAIMMISVFEKRFYHNLRSQSRKNRNEKKKEWPGRRRMGSQLVKLEFRLFDGTDLSPSKYVMQTTIATIKENILLQWP